jgi:hypothetical protein
MRIRKFGFEDLVFLAHPPVNKKTIMHKKPADNILDDSLL